MTGSGREWLWEVGAKIGGRWEVDLKNRWEVDS